MYLKRLILKQFRNYQDIDISFAEGNNLLIGENGQGKSNILEGIYLLGMTKAFRPVLDKDLVQFTKDSFFVKGEYEESGMESMITIGFQQSKKQIHHNETRIKKLSDLIGLLKVVLFSQGDIQLIMGPPAIRRKFMDMTLSLASKRYLEQLQNYHKVVKQRNTALKGAVGSGSQGDIFKIWDEQLIEMGSDLISSRIQLFEPMNEITQSLFNALRFDMSDFHLSYRPSIGKIDAKDSLKDQFRKKLKENERKEIQYKQSLYGPHKDDFAIRNASVDFKRFASQGQTRAGALTLRLAMTQYIESVHSCKTILLLDDVLLDLDNRKKEPFLELLSGRQNFFAATSLHGLEGLQGKSTLYTIQNGRVTKEASP